MFTASSFRALAFCAAISGSAFVLSGCGGGSSGPSAPPAPAPTPIPGAPTPTPTAPPVVTPSRQLLFDDFNAPTLDPTVWNNYVPTQEPLQRTGWGNSGINSSESGTTFTRLTLDSYNPSAPGRLFRGTEILTRTSYVVGNGLEAEARLRAPGLPPGLVAAFFLINDRVLPGPGSFDENYRKDEIDFELLTAQQEQFGGRNRLYTNVWNDWNRLRDGFDGNPNPENTPNRIHDDLVYLPSVDPAYDYANWNIYKIRWFADRTEFYVNNRLERIEREVKPNQALELHFNFWTPTGDFAQAFSGALPGPVATPDNPDRRVYQFDVDYVRLTALGSGAGSARLASGDEAVQPLPAYAQAARKR